VIQTVQNTGIRQPLRDRMLDKWHWICAQNKQHC